MKVGPTDTAASQPDMGAVITAQHREHVAKMIATGTAHGAKLLTGGDLANPSDAPNGYFVKPTILDGITYDNPLATHEVFGPVLNVMRAATLDEAIKLANRQAYGNGACIFTASGPAAREYRTRVSAGMVGINVGVPAPMAFFPFTGWNESFFGDLHIQGKEGVLFYTKQRTTTTRWFLPSEGDIWAR
jgi:malonate-semialdehyde dehydrogenase (acetylating)/methylmalonate-semialdehyde dehydrogenase